MTKLAKTLVAGSLLALLGMGMLGCSLVTFTTRATIGVATGA